MNNFPKPLIMPIKEVTNQGSDFPAGVGGRKKHYIVETQKTVQQQGNIWAVLQNSICVCGIEAKIKFSR